ncbi:hypothetical protein LIZ91_02615 [Enterococcus avium]|uniref:hypothetical protein n=1 Tax=Enterococcus TaxID=1350 RepID=UPI0008B41CDF|nr:MULTISPECIES: hypothetical protein [Enterococcus]MCB6915469.1 hypothetical protein [Enterococcus avium]MCQ4960430.1 hypothetical protein [Enterococcus avium]MDT2820617.1 hypothetical protein [Enterococcus devriesei]PNE51530.1 hypothetical protein AUF12_13980 [Enterococcus avium]SET33625.1 hypothetical protein SAMN04487821_11034 [Enterococcus malodoratus]
MAEIRVKLADEQEQDLKKYFYEIALDTLQQAKKDLGLDRDLVNRSEIQQWLDISPQFLDELMSLGLPYTLIGTKKYFFSKQEVRKFIIDFKRK